MWKIFLDFFNDNFKKINPKLFLYIRPPQKLKNYWIKSLMLNSYSYLQNQMILDIILIYFETFILILSTFDYPRISDIFYVSIS